MSDWRPMHEAPRDGTWILISGGTIRQRGEEGEHEFTGVGIAAYNKGMFDRDDGQHRHIPTAWMPSPPPVDAGAEGLRWSGGIERMRFSVSLLRVELDTLQVELDALASQGGGDG